MFVERMMKNDKQTHYHFYKTDPLSLTDALSFALQNCFIFDKETEDIFKCKKSYIHEYLHKTTALLQKRKLTWWTMPEPGGIICKFVNAFEPHCKKIMT